MRQYATTKGNYRKIKRDNNNKREEEKVPEPGLGWWRVPFVAWLRGGRVNCLGISIFGFRSNISDLGINLFGIGSSVFGLGISILVLGISVFGFGNNIFSLGINILRLEAAFASLASSEGLTSLPLPLCSG